MAEEISRQPSSDSVVCLLVITLMTVYNEMNKLGGKKKYTMYNLRRKRAPGNLVLEPSLVSKETRR